MMVEFETGSGFVTSVRTESVIRVDEAGDDWANIVHLGGERTLVKGSRHSVAERIENDSEGAARK